MKSLTTRTKLGALIQKPEVSARDMIDKLGHYEDLEEQGKLIKLPCDIDDTVYVIECMPVVCSYRHRLYDSYYCGEICKEKCDAGRRYIVKPTKIRSRNHILELLEEFDNTVFTSKTKADETAEELNKKLNAEKEDNHV